LKGEPVPKPEVQHHDLEKKEESRGQECKRPLPHRPPHENAVEKRSLRFKKIPAKSLTDTHAAGKKRSLD